MKHTLFLLLVILHSSCLTQKVDQTKETPWSTLLQSDKALVFENVVFDEVIDFTTLVERTKLRDGLYGHTIKPAISFINCTFRKEVCASRKVNNNMLVTTFMNDVSFQGCTFKEEFNFKGSAIQGRAIFANATFKAETNFEETSFYHRANFYGCKFEESLRFQNSFFNQKANFMKAEFFGAVSFQSVVFNGDAQFGVGKFYKYTDFSLVDCRVAFLFNYAEFSDRAVFSNAQFGGAVDFLNTLHLKSNFRKSKFMGEVRFFDSEVREEINLEETFFLYGIPELDFLEEGKFKLS